MDMYAVDTECRHQYDRGEAFHFDGSRKSLFSLTQRSKFILRLANGHRSNQHRRPSVAVEFHGRRALLPEKCNKASLLNFAILRLSMHQAPLTIRYPRKLRAFPQWHSTKYAVRQGQEWRDLHYLRTFSQGFIHAEYGCLPKTLCKL
jgi:hypothetical protein